MSDLIRRDDAIDAVHYYIESGYKCDIFQELKNLPSAEPERKTGKWEEKQVFDDADYGIPQWQSAKCSVCGKFHTTPYLYSFSDYPYCPHCGADMRGEHGKA